MKLNILIPLFILSSASVAYAHGEQILFVIGADIIVVFAWFIFLIKHKAPFLHKGLVYSSVLIPIIYTWLFPIPIESWYWALIEYPLLISSILAVVQSIPGIIILLVFRWNKSRSKVY